MILRRVLICLLVIYECENVFARYKDCSTCMYLRQCPEALSVAGNKDRATITKFRNAMCGTGILDGKRSPKICCSEFIDVLTRINVEPDNVKPEAETSIENHKNIGLLPENCGSIDGDRIIGGEFANIHEFPWMTLISYESKMYKGKKTYEFKCGGTVIHPRYILTAAHCVKDKKIAGVRIGDFDINSKEDCQGEYPYHICESHIQDITVKKFIVHEGFRTYPHVQNDIALLRLKKPIDFSYKNAAPICLPIYDGLRNITLGGKRATVAGWGLTEINKVSSILKKVNIPIKSEYECREYYDKNADSNSDVIDKKFCAGEEGKDSCKGDSGGPLMLEEEYKDVYRVVQFGVVSYGPQQCGSTVPGVYTDVTKYIKWILDNIK